MKKLLLILVYMVINGFLVWVQAQEYPILLYTSNDIIVVVCDPNIQDERELQVILDKLNAIVYPEIGSCDISLENFKKFYDGANSIMQKFDYLTQRIIKDETRDDFLYFENNNPLWQLTDQWVRDSTLPYAVYTLHGKQKKPIPNNFGELWHEKLYSWPPVGAYEPDYRQPSADLIKAFLFNISGKEFSVYGDTQIAEHVLLPNPKGQKGARRYAGNPIYAASEELPPGLQTCGVDANGNIWMADIEGHIAFFNTTTKEYTPKTLMIGGTTKLRIPRENASGSVFVFDDKENRYQEHAASPGGNAVAKDRHVPADTVQILFCNAQKIVYVTNAEVVLQARDVKDSRRLALGIEKGHPSPLDDDGLWMVPVSPNEKVVEGVYVDTIGEVALLIAKIPRNETYLEDVQDSWKTMRVELLDLNDKPR